MQQNQSRSLKKEFDEYNRFTADKCIELKKHIDYDRKDRGTSESQLEEVLQGLEDRIDMLESVKALDIDGELANIFKRTETSERTVDREKLIADILQRSYEQVVDRIFHREEQVKPSVRDSQSLLAEVCADSEAKSNDVVQLASLVDALARRTVRLPPVSDQTRIENNEAHIEEACCPQKTEPLRHAKPLTLQDLLI